ncbi:hypothetical protein BU15DRAFT_79010 [Melanogaster broomeanus]|nr:hypothetical protein BU15DRAFT_79010 [Melanogaster broomeanus]
MHVAGTPVLPVLFTVFQSIFQVFLLCLAGSSITSTSPSSPPHFSSQRSLSSSLQATKLRELWVIPIFFVVVTGLSGLVAHALARTCRLSRSQVNFATAASMFMNSNSLPVALMQSLASTVPLLKWGPDDSIDAIFGRSLTYLVVFSTLGMMLRWSYGIHLLSQADDEEPPAVPELRLPGGYRDEEESDTLTQRSVERIVVAPPTGTLIDYDGEVDVETNGHVWRGAEPGGLGAVAPMYSRLPAVPTSLGDESESESEPELESDSEQTLGARSSRSDVHTPIPTSSQAPLQSRARPRSLSSNVHPSTRTWSLVNILALLGWSLTALSPPLLASILALLTALCPPVQAALNSGAMTPVRGAIDGAGACSVPITLIVLGGWFWNGEEGKGPGKEHGGHDGELEGQGVDHHPNSDTTPTPTAPTNSTPTPRAIATPIATSTPTLHPPLIRPQSPSRNSSSTSMSSLLNAFGDVLLSKMHAHSTRSLSKTRADEEEGLPVFHGDENVGDLQIPNGRADAPPPASHLRRTAWGTKTAKHATNATTPQPASPTKTHSTGPAADTRRTPPCAPGESLTIFVTLVARMVLVPVILMPLMLLLKKWGGSGGVVDDPVFIVSSMLLLASPPALTLAQISQRARTATQSAETFSPFERLLSRTVFWAYCVLTPPITIASVMAGLILVGS